MATQPTAETNFSDDLKRRLKPQQPKSSLKTPISRFQQAVACISNRARAWLRHTPCQ
ncbi:hypothetical protein [Neisseria sicca]|uniref:hypothetical protein n=1 Tax=Neisseria sicca TaxID=490 RepID=UPI00190140F6|nr:hypothetical protein [Neisseria sicca]